MKRYYLIMTLLIIGAAVAPVADSQTTAQHWQIIPDNTLYFVGEDASVTVLGPENCFFIMSVVSVDNNYSIAAFYQKSTGPDCNTTIDFEIYESRYDTGTYLLNISYEDIPVVSASISVVLDKIKLMEIHIDRLIDEGEQTRMDLMTLQDSINEIWDILRDFVMPAVVVALLLVLWFSQRVMVFVEVPRIRWTMAQSKNKANAWVNLGRKVDLDIMAVNGVQHPKVPDSQYLRIVERMRSLEYDDATIDQIFRDETGEFAPSLKPVPVGALGKWLILKRKGVIEPGKLDDEKDDDKDDDEADDDGADLDADEKQEKPKRKSIKDWLKDRRERKKPRGDDAN